MTDVIAGNKMAKQSPAATVRGCFAEFVRNTANALAITFCLLYGTLSFAASPWNVDANQTGTAAGWPYDSSEKKYRVYWFSDPGRLSSKEDHDNAEGVNLVKELFDQWRRAHLQLRDGTSIESAALEFVYCGNLNNPLPNAPPGCAISEEYKAIADINAENFRKFDEPPLTQTPPTVVIFDVDGSIMANYRSPVPSREQKFGIVGLAQNYTGADTKTIRFGFLVLNGTMINGERSGDDNEISLEAFKGPVLHEIGHLLNLDHAQVNLDIAQDCTLDDCSQSNAVTTMFPEVKTEGQNTLHPDDMASISWLYPNDDFKSKFCTIQGDILDPDGKGLQGVNVTVKNIEDPFIDAKGWVSGSLYKPMERGGHNIPIQNGRYIFPGIRPGFDYEVAYEPIAAPYRNRNKPASAIGPLVGETPHGFPPGHIPGPGGSQTVRCNQGGETISMPAYQITAVSSDGGEGVQPSESVSEKKGFLCSLDKNQPFSAGHGISLLLIFLAPFLFFRERLKANN